MAILTSCARGLPSVKMIMAATLRNYNVQVRYMYNCLTFQVKGYDCVTVCVTVCATVCATACATVGATVGATVVTVVVVEAVADTDSCWLALICPFFCAIWA